MHLSHALLLAALAISAATAPARAQELSGTLKKVKDTGAITIGYRDASVPFSYLDGNQKPVATPSRSVSRSPTRSKRI